jgi:hypothetical protein
VTIHHESVKSPVQAFRKIRLFFIAMNQIGRRLARERVPALAKRGLQFWIREFFAGEEEINVAVFVANRHAIGEAPSARHPADVDAQLGIAPGAAVVEGLMAETLHHRQQLLLGNCLGLFCDESDDSRQDESP